MKEFMRVVVICRRDESSGWRIVESVRRYTSISITHIKLEPGRFNCPTDYLISEETLPIIQDLVNSCDIVHFKGNDVPSRQYLGLTIPQKTKIICTVNGPVFRRPLPGQKPNRLAYAKYPIEDYVRNSDFRTVLCPDLNYPEFKAIYTPFAIDSESQPYTWKLREPFVIGYYDSAAKGDRKGVQQFILPALKYIQAKGIKFELVRIQDMTLQESVEIKKHLTLFIDQVCDTGCYGNSAIEAMQYGVPTVAYISELSKKQSKSDEFCSSPILSPREKSIEALIDLLESIFEGKIDLELISKQSKAYCDSFHGYKRRANMWKTIYEGVYHEEYNELYKTSV